MRERYKHLARATVLAGVLGVGGHIVLDRLSPAPVVDQYSLRHRLDAVEQQVNQAEMDLGKKKVATIGTYDIYQHANPETAQTHIQAAIQMIPDRTYNVNSVRIDLGLASDDITTDLAPQPQQQSPSPQTAYYMYGMSSPVTTPDWSNEETWLEMARTDITYAKAGLPK